MSQSTRIRCFADRRDGNGVVEISQEQVPERLGGESLVWVDILAPASESNAWLARTFGFHELALSDLLNNETRPKQESYDNVLFTVFRAINLNPGEDAFDTINLSIFLTDRFIVSSHVKPVRTVNILTERVEKDRTAMARGTSFFFYMLLDGVVDRCLDILDAIEEKIDDLEDRVFATNDPSVQQDIFSLKKQVSSMRRLIAPEREALTSLINSPIPQITLETRTHLRDVLDHVLRAQDMLESYRDLLAGLMDSYMTRISNRMNEVMKMLSIIATIMLPLGFLTGLFGMNFDVIPFIHSPHGFWGLMAAMTILVGFMFWVFKKKDFL